MQPRTFLPSSHRICKEDVLRTVPNSLTEGEHTTEGEAGVRPIDLPHHKEVDMASMADVHRRMLLDSAITPEVIDTSSIRSDARGLHFPWTDGTSATVWQTRPDKPRVDAKGREIKYEFPKGAKVPFNRLRDGAGFESVLITEGTKQSLAALSHAPVHLAVYGMAGCRGYVHADLMVAKDRDVFLLLDADFETNVDVWTAAEELTKRLKRSGARSVRYVSTTGTGKDGLDDVLARMGDDAQRREMLKLWLSQAAPKLPRKPRAKVAELSETDAKAAELFRKVEGRMLFQPVETANRIMDIAPAAITSERNIAMYVDGVYRVDSDALLSVVVDMLGNFYSPGNLKSATDALIGQLYKARKRLPERMDTPLLNCPNGMVDLRTGELLDHSPEYMSYVQVTTDYAPDMETPVYDQWLMDALWQPGATHADVLALVDDIEETAGTMLDPSKTPSKALFLFGPSRSGKSTFLRLLKAIAGAANTSAVTLHELGTDQFATANLYGKMLNVAADLSNAHVADLSKFKMATGEDLLNANRKYGQQFSFTNQALFAFSANELPTVSEASRAYAERMKPFNFPNSFAGREDKRLEDKLMAELPGILARWVTAYGRFLARGGYAQTDVATQADFEAKSDRVVQFFQDMCTLTEASHRDKLADHECTGRRDTAVAFNAWAERNGGSKMGEKAFFRRFEQIAGVVEVRYGPGGNKRAYNVTVARADDDTWQDEPEAVSAVQSVQEVLPAPVPAPRCPDGAQHLDGSPHTCLADNSDDGNPWADPFADGLDMPVYQL